MSIINDALKKVQNKLNKNDPVAPPPETPPVIKQTAPTTPAGPLPPNTNSPYHQSGKPVFPTAQYPPITPQPTAPKTAYPTPPPPKVDAASIAKDPKKNNTGMLVLIFFALAAIAIFMYRKPLQPFVTSLMPKLSKSEPLSYSKTELIPTAVPVVSTETPPPSKKAAKPPQFKLNGTMVMGSKTVALINGNILEVGNQIEGFTIKEISIKKVILEKEGETFELVVKNEF